MAESKYAPLTKHLKSLNYNEIPMTFEDIANVVGKDLPPSAFKHRPWWSNNPSNSVITYAWLNAGYKTSDVDMEKRRLVFRKIHASADKKSPADAQPRSLHGFEDEHKQFEGPTGGGGGKKRSRFEDIWGCMKGTIKIMLGADITAPVYSDEELAEIEAEQDRKWNDLLTQKNKQERRL